MVEYLELDYERYILPKDQSTISNDKSVYEEYETGTIQFDPNKKLIIFSPETTQDTTTNLVFTIPISDIKLQKHFINDKKIVFPYTTTTNSSSKHYEIQIFNSSKEVIGERSFNEILRQIEKHERKCTKLSQKQNKGYQYIINGAKDYQLEMLNIAKTKNIIVFLETGLGKTYISILLLKHIYNEPIEANITNRIEYVKQTSKKTLFLFETVSLLLQQSKVIKQNTNLKVFKMFGDSKSAYTLNKTKFQKALNKYDIICATPECIYRYFSFGYITITDIALIVMDECHHCIGDDYYNKLLKHFVYVNGYNTSASTRVLGLTASPIFNDNGNIIDSIQKLCNNMGCYLVCPSNIINNNNVLNKEIEFFELNKMCDVSEEKKTQNKIKNFLFFELIMPILTYHYTMIYNKLIQKFKPHDEQQKEKTLIHKEFKREIQMYIAMNIINYYLTLFVDNEQELQNKFLGLYDKSDYELIEQHVLKRMEEIEKIVKENRSKKENDNDDNDNTDDNGLSERINEEYEQIINIFKPKAIRKYLNIFKEELDNSNTLYNGNSHKKNVVNMNKLIKDFNKMYNDDTVITHTKKYTQLINLIIRYININSVYEFTKEFYSPIQNDFLLHKLQSNDDDEFTNSIHNKFNIINNLLTDPFKDYESSYFKSIMQFIIKENNNTNNNSNSSNKTLIFTNHRHICKELNNAINRKLSSRNITTIKSTYVVGIADNAGKINVSFSDKDLKHNLNMFRNDNTCNILIATNVVEEGIDVQQCNNVICLSDIVTIKEYIQKSGRARKENSDIYLFSHSPETKRQKINDINIKIDTIKAMKQLIESNTLTPQYNVCTYVQNYNHYKTISGANIYLSFAKRIVDEFISQLFNDGYNFVRIQKKVMTINNNQYRPYLLLPAVLETKFQCIYDNDSSKTFPSEKKALDYLNKYEDYYYLKILKLLHMNRYLDDTFRFQKGYDELIHSESNYIKCESEFHVKIKQHNTTPTTTINTVSSSCSCDYIEYTAHIVKFTPNYFDINYNDKGKRYVTLLSENKLQFGNFDLFIPSKLLIKLYYVNYHFNDGEEETIKWYSQKPKIPYSIFSKMNISIDEHIQIKIPKTKLDLINFFYTYTLFVSTDAEMFFYYSIYTNKFDFCKTLFPLTSELESAFKTMFQHYDLEYLSMKHHLKLYNLSELNYQQHLVKFSFIQYNETTKTYVIDYDYIERCYHSVINDIILYAKFIKRCLHSDESRERMLNDKEYLKQKESELERTVDTEHEPQVGSICRNLFNFSKMIVMNYSQTDIRGSLQHKRYKDLTNQQYYIYKYGVLTQSMRDYKKCLVLDYNQRLLKYKINLKHLGNVVNRFNKPLFIKRFHFFPNEVIHPITFATIDQLHVFTMFPVILFKLQNNLIYYYHANTLMNQFKYTFKEIRRIDMKMFMQAVNSKTTLEIDNYERLEFLGDAILKLLSSVELFVEFPQANRDLLFSKRRIIENNKHLFEKANEFKLYQYLFTRPITIKRVSIPGFTKDESLIFNLSYNKSFTKQCFLHKIQVKTQESNNASKRSNEQQQYKVSGTTMMDTATPSTTTEATQYNEMENELKTDKSSIDIKYESNIETPEPNDTLNIDCKDIKDIIDKNIELVPGKTFRFIYMKNLADVIESLTGFIYVTSIHSNNYSQQTSLNNASKFLKEVNILSNEYIDNIKQIKTIALTDLINTNCRFSKEKQQEYCKPILDNPRYKFKNNALAYQAMTHSSCLSNDNNSNYVNKSYQRLAFLGEAILGLYVSIFVYTNCTYASESTLHKMKICGINHNIISLLAIELKLHDNLFKDASGLKTDIDKYEKLLQTNGKDKDNKYKISNEDILDESFVIVLCELFHSYIAAIYIDNDGNIQRVFEFLDGVMKHYLENNATIDTYTEHPKVVILDEFGKRKQYFKSIKENGENRLKLKYNENGGKFRNIKSYEYHLIIDKYIIYQEKIFYNKATIRKAQEKAKTVFLEICKEIDRREKLKMNQNQFNLKDILDYLKIKYSELK